MTIAQNQASDPTYSVWVAASAGTGKTTVLTSRVLRLLLNGTNPGKILCLTYTNAGAAEMECRIKAKLCEWVTLSEHKLVEELTNLNNSKPTSETIKRARKLFLETLDTPDGIKIQTIHSFCQGLMRRFPLEAGIVPHFKVMDDKTAKELLKEARTRLLSNSDAYTPQIKAAINNIFKRIREGTFAEVIESIINDRGKFESAIAKAGVDGLKSAIFKLLDVPEGTDEKEVILRAVAEGSFDRKNLQASAALLEKQSGKTFVERGSIICSWLAQDEESRVINFDYYKLAFLTKEDEPRKAIIPTKTTIPHESLQNEQARIYTVCNDIKKTRVAVLSSCMVDIAYSLLQYYVAEKAGKAYLDYNDLIIKSENLLSQGDIAPWVLYKLDGGIDHILLDEAQDTSLQQWHIIDSLCAEFFVGAGARDVERTVFVVGDEKQSIFSFQGAAPQIFNKMQERFKRRVEEAGKKWRSVQLDESFRSSPVILQAVDAVRAELLAVSGQSNEFSPLDSMPSLHIAHRKEMFGKIEVWPLVEHTKEESKVGWVMPLEYKDKQDTRKILADKIADQIKGWLDGGRILECEGRAVRAGDIIILLRKRREMADNIISSLKKRNIAVAGHDRLIITEHIAVMDLMALGNFLLLPEDDLSLACVLKSPLLGFTEEELFKISYGREKKSLWQSLKEQAKFGEPFAGCVVYLSRLLSKVDFLTPFALYCYILETIGARKQLVQRLGYEVNDPVDEFLSLALLHEKSHAPSLQGFLSWLESGQSQIKRDMEQGGSDTVRVMTVHGSKGLEAPIVIMPDTTSDFTTSKSSIFWYENYKDDTYQGDVMLWPGNSYNMEEICKSIKQRIKFEQEKEYYRLLYVAMTRAKSELYIMGSIGGQKRLEGCWYDVIYNALASIATKNEYGVLQLSYGNPSSLKESQISFTSGRITLPGYLLTPSLAEPTPTYPLTPSRIEGESGLGGYKESSLLKALEGKIIHTLLEFLPDIAQPMQREVGRRFLEKQILLTPDLLINIDVILQNIIYLISSSGLKDVFGKYSHAEVPIVGVIDGVVVSARIDRLCVLADKVIIVDYKTGSPPTQSAGINKAYIKQMAIYKEVIQKIYTLKQIECYLIWTEGCLVYKLPDTAEFHDKLALEGKSNIHLELLPSTLYNVHPE